MRAQRCRVHRIPFPTSVTIAKRPSVGQDNERFRSDLGQAGNEIFLQKGLDRQSGKTRSDLPVRQICAHVQDGLSPSRNPSPSFQNMMGIAEFIIGRAFARPVGSAHPTALTRSPGAALDTVDQHVNQLIKRAIGNRRLDRSYFGFSDHARSIFDATVASAFKR